MMKKAIQPKAVLTNDTGYIDREKFRDTPLTYEAFVQAKDTDYYFALRNTFEIPTLFGNCARSVFEDGFEDFKKLFYQYLKHSDFDAIDLANYERSGNADHRFADSAAYRFYFWETMTQTLSVFPKYIIQLVEKTYEKINDGMKKIQELDADLQTQHLNSHYQRCHLRLTRLKKVLDYKGFKSLRNLIDLPGETSNGHRKPSRSSTSKMIKEMTLSDQFQEIIMGSDRSIASEHEWKKNILKVMRHHPKTPCDQPSNLMQVLEGLFYVIDNAIAGVVEVSRKLELDNEFYLAYVGIIDEHGRQLLKRSRHPTPPPDTQATDVKVRGLRGGSFGEDSEDDDHGMPRSESMHNLDLSAITKKPDNGSLSAKLSRKAYAATRANRGSKKGLSPRTWAYPSSSASDTVNNPRRKSRGDYIDRAVKRVEETRATSEATSREGSNPGSSNGTPRDNQCGDDLGGNNSSPSP